MTVKQNEGEMTIMNINRKLLDSTKSPFVKTEVYIWCQLSVFWSAGLIGWTTVCSSTELICSVKLHLSISPFWCFERWIIFLWFPFNFFPTNVFFALWFVEQTMKFIFCCSYLKLEFSTLEIQEWDSLESCYFPLASLFLLLRSTLPYCPWVVFMVMGHFDMSFVFSL